MNYTEAFKVCLFGSFQASLNDVPLTGFHSSKTRALLAYLVMEANRPHSRDSLATLLWGDQTSQKARTNLRTTFAKLRQLLAPLEADTPLFTTTRQTIQLNLNPAHHWVDAKVFDDLLTQYKEESGDTPIDIPACAKAISQAISLYQGEFLSDLWVENAEAFEAWRLEQQEKYHLRMLSLLNCLAGYHLSNTHNQLDYQLAEQYARQQLTLEPWSEVAHSQLMEILAKTGQQTAALAQFEICRQVLAEELGMEPSPETAALAEKIRRGELDRSVQTQTATPQLSWTEIPLMGTFFGRSNELAQLQQWLVEERCRLVTILGIGGQGKTSLAVQLAHTVSPQFDVVTWHSLLNAPQLDEILPSILQTLNGSPVFDYPDSLDEQLSLLLHHLRQKRCLLVLDNLETILQSGLAGQYRSSYEAYGQLIETIAQHQHQSCLLLTSRERPQNRSLKQTNLPGIQSLALNGLDVGAAHQILQVQGVTVNQIETHHLARRYSGNPLALNLVSQTIQDIYFGSIEAFLNEETPIFDDIRSVLDEQFNRLSPLERDILLWLAISREPLFPPDLTALLARPIRQRELLETLHSLQQRLLLERDQAGFRLQNVIIEYLTDYLVEQISQEIEQGQLSLLHSHALLHTQAKTYVRQSQRRLILQPIAERLEAQLGLAGFDQICRHFLDQSRQSSLPASYAAGNILNLLLYLEIEVSNYDFSGLQVWQADLQGKLLPGVNFSQADLSGSTFTDIFDVIYSVAFSPDGQLLAAGGVYGRIRIWSVATGQPIALLDAQTPTVLTVAFSPDGQTLASNGSHGDEQVIYLWEVGTWQRLKTLQGHADGVSTVAFSPDGQSLASGSNDHTIRLWDIKSGQTYHTLIGHSNNVQTVAFNPKGQILVSGSRDHTVRLWDLSDPTPSVSSSKAKYILQEHGSWVNAVAISPNGQTLASSGEDGTIYLWDLSRLEESQPYPNTPSKTLTTQPHGVQAVAFSPDGQSLASGSNDHIIRLWNVETGQPTQILQGHKHWIRTVAYSPNGQMLASGGWDQTVQLWDVEQPGHYPRQTFEGYSNVTTAVTYSPDGQMLASAHTHELVRLWDITTKQLRYNLQGHKNWVWHIAFSPDGETLASSSYDHTVRLWNAKTGRLQEILHGPQDSLQGIAFSPDGQTLAGSGMDHIIYLWDVKQGVLKQTLKHHTNWVQSVAFSPDEQILASSSGDQSIILWDVTLGQVRTVLTGHEKGIQNIRFSPDGTLLASISWDTTIRLWDTNSGECRHILEGHTQTSQGVAFSPDGQTLASCSYDQTIRLWDVNTGQPRQVLTGHTGWVLYVAYSPDGQTLASCGTDDTIKFWNPATGTCLESWEIPGPYEGMNISGATGITEAQRSALKALGAVEN